MSPVIHGRLVCCTCGADLGDAEDPYRDPDCGECFKRQMQQELEDERAPFFPVGADERCAHGFLGACPEGCDSEEG